MAHHRKSAWRLVSVIVVASLVFAHSASAQVASPIAPRPAASRPFVFEVASVKATKSTESYVVRFTPYGAIAKGVPLKPILQAAYNQYNDQYWFAVPALCREFDRIQRTGT